MGNECYEYIYLKLFLLLLSIYVPLCVGAHPSFLSFLPVSRNDETTVLGAGI